MSFSRCLLLLVLLVMAAGLRADEWQTDESVVVPLDGPEGKKLALRIPEGWQHRTVSSSPTLLAVSVTDPAKKLSLVFTFRGALEGRYDTKAKVDDAVTTLSQTQLKRSVEKTVTLVPIEGRVGYGCYASFTLAEFAEVEPPAGKFRNYTRGIIQVRQQSATFTVNSNDTTSQTYKQALRIVSAGILPR